MDESIQVLYKNAVLKEQLAKKMYLDLAKKCSGDLKKLFLMLADEEAVHEKLFAKMDLNVLKKVNNSKFQGLHLLKNVDSKNIIFNDKKDINNALDFAINEEEKAFNDYNLLINHIPFGETRETLKEMSIQEKKHKTLLQKIKLEFNDNDWKVI